MTTKEATIYFENDSSPLPVEFNWIDPIDDLAENFIERFSLKETKENITLVTKRGETDLESFIAYIGSDITDARAKHPQLNTLFLTAETTDSPNGYGINTSYGIGALQVFFTRIAQGDVVTKIELAAAEQA